jgi:hypothetical protein
MKWQLALVAAVFGVVLCPADVLYQVEQGPIGFDGATVAGTIQTDGITGALTASDILNWNVVVTNGLGSSFDLTNANSTLSLAGTALTATATQLQFNFGSAPPWGTLGNFELLEDGGNGWGWALAGVDSAPLEQVLPLGADGDAGLKALSPQPVTLGTILTPLPLQGGTSSSPVFLARASVGGVQGTIGGFGSEDYYFLNWVGGPFSASATVDGAAPGASYLFSLGAVGSCNSSAVPLDSSNAFSNTLFLSNLARGNYCIGLDANSLSDPHFALVFNTPVSGVPEPSVFGLLSAGIGILGMVRRSRTIKTRIGKSD